MHALLALWLPILLSAVAIFIISSILHMVLKGWHTSDYKGFANEDAVRAAINAGNPAPGRYVIPYCTDSKDWGSEAMKQKYREGPVGHVTLGPVGMPVLGKFLGQWFVWSLLVSAIAAYVAARVYGLDHSHAHSAAKLIGVIVFAGLGFGTITESIWSMRPWVTSVKYLVDSALYGLGAALVFCWLWP